MKTDKVAVTIDTKNICHNGSGGGCQNQAQPGKRICATCEGNHTRLAEFLARERLHASQARVADKPIVQWDSIQGTKDCYLCANCRRLFKSPSKCCEQINLIHVETASLVFDRQGGIVECRPVSYSIQGRPSSSSILAAAPKP